MVGRVQKWVRNPGKGSERWQKFHTDSWQWRDCETAAAEMLHGDIDGALHRLRHNGYWGIDPWPDKKLRAAVSAAMDTKSLTSALAAILHVDNPYIG